MKSTKVTKLLSICPHCVRTIGEDWKEAGSTVEIEHHSEFLARYSAQLPSSGGADTKIVFHDPCYLGRYRGIYDEPREILKRTGTLVEAERSREGSFCCGAGGGLVFLGKQTGKRASTERAEQLASTVADVVAAASPFCNTMSRDALAQISPAAP